MKNLLENFFYQEEINGVLTLELSDETKRFKSDDLNYKGRRYFESEDGLTTLVNVCYTADVLASKMGSSHIDVGSASYQITSYRFPGFWKDCIEVGRCYTTPSAIRTQKKEYDVVKPYEGDIEIKVDGKSYMMKPRTLTPNQVDNFFNQLGRDTELFKERQNLESKLCSLFDFQALLITGDVEYLYDFNSTGRFTETVAAAREVTGPFAKEYDLSREVPNEREVMLCLIR